MLLAAFLVSRSCGSSEPDVSQSEAEQIARDAVDYEPDRVLVRVIRRGIPPRSYWAVSLQTFERTDSLDVVTVVVIDGQTGEITEIRRE